jgi:hypothetical protein
MLFLESGGIAPPRLEHQTQRSYEMLPPTGGFTSAPRPNPRATATSNASVAMDDGLHTPIKAGLVWRMLI